MRPPGQTATIGRKGDVPIANGHFDSQHAQLTRLPDGSFELTDGFGGRPSGRGMGQNYEDLKNYGTYVRRVSADGAVTCQQVSATEPTIVLAGDEIYLGYNPERNRGTSLSIRIVVPE